MYVLTVPFSRSLQHEAANRAEIHRQSAEYRIGSVCLSMQAEPSCVEQIRQSQRENERQEFELAAQRMAAWWAQVMGVAAVIGLGLSAVGIWLVKITFDETRMSNNIAKSSTRPWLRIDVFSDHKDMDCVVGFGENGSMIAIGLTIKNVGTGIATNVRFKSKVIAVTTSPGEFVPEIVSDCKFRHLASFPSVLVPSEKIECLPHGVLCDIAPEHRDGRSIGWFELTVLVTYGSDFETEVKRKLVVNRSRVIESAFAITAQHLPDAPDRYR